MLRKAWSFSSSEGVYLYKGGTEGFANAGNEPYCEFYASQVAKAMGLHAIEYDLVNWHGIVSSKCKLFTDIDTSYVPIGRVVKKSDIDSCIDFYKELGDSYYQEMATLETSGSFVTTIVESSSLLHRYLTTVCHCFVME